MSKNTGIHSNTSIGKSDKLDVKITNPYDRNYNNHDASTCIIENGKIIYANSEERFTMVKHDGTSTRNLMIDINSHLDRSLLSELIQWQEQNPSDFVDHHITHIYETFYNSGFDEAAVFVNDGCGTDDDCVTLAYMERGKEPLILRKFPKTSSLGVYYSQIAGEIFRNGINKGDYSEGKLMGLSSYGKPMEKRLMRFDGENLIRSPELNEILGAETDENGFVHRRSKTVDDHDNHIWILNDKHILHKAIMAATAQRDFEECVIGLIVYFRNLLDENGIHTRNLCLSGGCILNCPTNSKIVDMNLFDNYYASPNPGDGGVCLGFLYKKLIDIDNSNAFEYKRLETAYLGHGYSMSEIRSEISHNSHYRKYLPWILEPEDNSLATICQLLNDQKIVGWFQGGSEFGPRALGHRSFLADPRSENMLFKLNMIKGREPWRPLAPVVPEELFKDVFEVENTDMCQFMLRTLTVKEKWRDKLNAICHVDNTARPQLLRKKDNPELYALLMMWYRKTGCPCLINTSLNIAGLPIVETPGHLIDLMDEANTREIYGTYVGGIADIMLVPGIVSDKENRHESA